MHSTLDDLLPDKGLLLLEEKWVTRDRETADIEGMLTIRGPRSAEVRCDVLGAVGVLWVHRGGHTSRFGGNLGWASVVLLVAGQSELNITWKELGLLRLCIEVGLLNPAGHGLDSLLDGVHTDLMSSSQIVSGMDTPLYLRASTKSLRDITLT